MNDTYRRIIRAMIAREIAKTFEGNLVHLETQEAGHSRIDFAGQILNDGLCYVCRGHIDTNVFSFDLDEDRHIIKEL